MKEEDKWNPETKLWLLSALKSRDITAGKLSVKSQFITHNSNSHGSEWRQSSTCGFQRVGTKLQQKADLSSSKEIRCAECKCIGLAI